MLDHPLPTPLQKLEPFLRAVEYTGPLSVSQSSKVNWPFITISRQAGAGGRTLARALLRAMSVSANDALLQGWDLFDVQTCLHLLEKAHLRVPYEALLEEEYHTPMEDLAYQLLAQRPPQEDILHRVTNGIRALARAGKVIIVGRGGACVTSDLPQGVHIRLVADLADRVDRMSTVLHIPQEKAKQLIVDRDRQRDRLIQKYYGRSISDPLLYDAVWNTSRLPVETLVPLILQLLHAKAPQPHHV